MKSPALPANHPKQPKTAKTGVLLVNLGTPEAPTAAALRPYLREFLGDKRVVELPRWLWLPLLYGVIVPLRAPKSAHAYAQIWDKTHNASPLKVITEAQTAKLQKRLGKNVVVRYAMRYGQPSIPSQLDALMAAGCDEIVLAPLYPQYAGPTVGTVVDVVADWLKARRWQPAIRTLAPYYDHPAYIKALAESVRADFKKAKAKPQVLVASFHGMPLKACQAGDVYYCHCHKTARLLAEELGVPFCKSVEEVKEAALRPAPNVDTRLRGHDALRACGLPPVLLAFQSRFGRDEWLQPYFSEVIEALPAAGITQAAVISPAFAADCVETLEELAIGGKESFVGAGGKGYGVTPCLNDSDGGMEMLEALVREIL
ncbi:MAG: ferrochelatase [Pseudomonadaceae bacterium]|nr:ferrochelatase [Pseudomonadaceae bacterium]